MTKLSITLRDKDGEFTVTQEYVSGQKLLDYWDMAVEIEKNADKISISDVYKKRINFIAGLFDSSKVTEESILASVPAWGLQNFIKDVFETITGSKEVTGDEKKEQ